MTDSHEASPVDFEAVHTERPSNLCVDIHSAVSITGIADISYLNVERCPRLQGDYQSGRNSHRGKLREHRRCAEELGSESTTQRLYRGGQHEHLRSNWQTWINSDGAAGDGDALRLHGMGAGAAGVLGCASERDVCEGWGSADF